MYYSKRHYTRLSNGAPDTAESAAERIHAKAAGEQANAEMMVKFSPLTTANAREAIAWQEARIKELMS